MTLVRFVDRQSGRVTIVQPDEHARRRHEWLIGASAHAAKCFYAGERVATLVFDRRGNRVWRQAKSLLDSEHARPALGEVAAPYGVCTEPSNAKPEAVPAPTGSAASAVTISALTSLTCPTCTPTSTTCCETGSVSSLPPTSTTGC